MIIQTDKQMRPRDPADFYPTPIEVCRAALNLIPWNISSREWLRELICDPGAGTGVWGKAALERWGSAQIDGCDSRDLARPDGYERWLPKKDYLQIEAGQNVYDATIGNPPYKFAEQFVRKALYHTRPDGYVLFLLRLAFLEGQARARGLWTDYPPKAVHVLSARPSFIASGDKAGKTDATAYAIFLWQKGWTGQTALGWLNWKESEQAETQLSLFDTGLAPEGEDDEH